MKTYIRTSMLIEFLEKEKEKIGNQKFKNLFTGGRTTQIDRILHFIKKYQI